MLVVWGVAFAAASLLLLALSGQTAIQDAMQGRVVEVPMVRRMLWSGILWYGWALLAPGVAVLCLRFPLVPGRWRRSLFVLVSGFVAFYFLHVGLQVTAMFLPTYRDVHETLREAVVYHMVTSLRLNGGVYWLIVGAAHAVLYYHAYRQRELEAVRLESELAQARLHALKTQLHPHFLFNTLHSISTLMYRDVRAADRMLARLSDLLRLALDRSDAQEVPLREELAFVETYVDIEHIRLGDRLTVHVDVDPALDDVLVPSLVLQPLVENAVKHGIAPRTAPGVITIRARAVGDRLHLRVADDGVGMPEVPSSNGIGLANVRARLGRLYGDAHRLTFGSAYPTGLVVDLEMPLRRAANDVQALK